LCSHSLTARPPPPPPPPPLLLLLLLLLLLGVIGRGGARDRTGQLVHGALY